MPTYEINTEILPAREYMVIPGYFSWHEIKEDERADWAKRFGDVDAGRVGELTALAGGDAVYRLFCNNCVEDKVFSWVCGDDIACENKKRAKAKKGLRLVRLAASLYCKITFVCGKGEDMERAAKDADEYFWNTWLPANPYVSKIEGDFANAPETAAITLVDEDSRRVTLWHPLAKK
jgi:predicted transcriptional regulator YdeE